MFRRILLCALPLALAATALLGQGALDPAGAPAPTMRSLQEIWDRVGTLEAQEADLQRQFLALQKENTILLDDAGAGWAWQVSTIDTLGGDHVDPSLKFSPDGRASIAYYDQPRGDLKFAQFDGTAWQITKVDGGGCVSPSLAFDAAGQPAIAYCDTDGSFNTYSWGPIKFARFDGSAWHLEVPWHGKNPSLAFSPTGMPVIVFRQWVPEASRDFWACSVSHDGVSWSAKYIENFYPQSRTFSVAFSPAGIPTVAFTYGGYLFGNNASAEPPDRVYVAAPDTLFSRMPWTRFEWSFIKPYFNAECGEYLSHAYSADGAALVAFFRSDTGDLYLMRFDGSVSQTSVIDSEGTVGEHPSLAISATGQPAIAYLDVTNDRLKFASSNGSSWKLTTIAAAGSGVVAPVLAFAPNGQPAIAYYDRTTGALKLAVRTLPNGR